MKIYILYAKENWITDILFTEWVQYNTELYTNNIMKQI